MQPTLVRIKLQKLIPLFIHPYSNHSIKIITAFFAVIVHIQSSVERPYIGVGQPICTLSVYIEIFDYFTLTFQTLNLLWASWLAIAIQPARMSRALVSIISVPISKENARCSNVTMYTLPRYWVGVRYFRALATHAFVPHLRCSWEDKLALDLVNSSCHQWVYSISLFMNIYFIQILHIKLWPMKIRVLYVVRQGNPLAAANREFGTFLWN